MELNEMGKYRLCPISLHLMMDTKETVLFSRLQLINWGILSQQCKSSLKASLPWWFKYDVLVHCVGMVSSHEWRHSVAYQYRVYGAPIFTHLYQLCPDSCSLVLFSLPKILYSHHIQVTIISKQYANSESCIQMESTDSVVYITNTSISGPAKGMSERERWGKKTRANKRKRMHIGRGAERRLCSANVPLVNYLVARW